jgi:uncharacterized protein (UPF0305 family)
MDKLKNLQISSQMSKNELLEILKEESALISIQDIMESSIFILEDSKYVQAGYREKFIDAYVKGFVVRIKEIRDNKKTYQGIVDTEELKDSLNLLKEQEDMVGKQGSVGSRFFIIYQLISIYTTYVLEEPIHLVGTPFPGGFQVKYEDGIYLCPVKERQKDNPSAVCGFCIAEQDPETMPSEQ